MMNYPVDEIIQLTIIAMGDLTSRKTETVIRFVNDEYLEEMELDKVSDSYPCSKKVHYGNKIQNVTFHLLDLWENDEYSPMAEEYTRDFHHFALVYAIDSYLSLNFLEDALQKIGQDQEIGERPVYMTMLEVIVM